MSFLRDLIEILHRVDIIQKAIFTFKELGQHIIGAFVVF